MPITYDPFSRLPDETISRILTIGCETSPPPIGSLEARFPNGTVIRQLTYKLIATALLVCRRFHRLSYMASNGHWRYLKLELCPWDRESGPLDNVVARAIGILKEKKGCDIYLVMALNRWGDDAEGVSNRLFFCVLWTLRRYRSQLASVCLLTVFGQSRYIAQLAFQYLFFGSSESYLRLRDIHLRFQDYRIEPDSTGLGVHEADLEEEKPREMHLPSLSHIELSGQPPTPYPFLSSLHCLETLVLYPDASSSLPGSYSWTWLANIFAHCGSLRRVHMVLKQIDSIPSDHPRVCVSRLRELHFSTGKPFLDALFGAFSFPHLQTINLLILDDIPSPSIPEVKQVFRDIFLPSLTLLRFFDSRPQGRGDPFLEYIRAPMLDRFSLRTGPDWISSSARQRGLTIRPNSFLRVCMGLDYSLVDQMKPINTTQIDALELEYHSEDNWYILSKLPHNATSSIGQQLKLISLRWVRRINMSGPKTIVEALKILQAYFLLPTRFTLQLGRHVEVPLIARDAGSFPRVFVAEDLTLPHINKTFTSYIDGLGNSSFTRSLSSRASSFVRINLSDAPVAFPTDLFDLVFENLETLEIPIDTCLHWEDQVKIEGLETEAQKYLVIARRWLVFLSSPSPAFNRLPLPKLSSLDMTARSGSGVEMEALVDDANAALKLRKERGNPLERITLVTVGEGGDDYVQMSQTVWGTEKLGGSDSDSGTE